MDYVNNVYFRSGVGGTSDFTMGTAETGFYGLTTCVNNKRYRYRAYSDDKTQYEEGQGVVTTGGTPTITRERIFSSSTGSKVSFSAAPRVFLTPLADDLNSEFPAGLLFGLTLSNNGTDATNDIDIAAGRAADSTNTFVMILAAALTKRIDAAWSVGSGNGGMDTGSVANSNWYYVHLIMRPDTGVVDALFSLSRTAPTLPANYVYFRCIGAIRRNASATNLAFVQQGDKFILSTKINDVNVATSGTAALVALTVPPSMVAIFRAVLQIDTGVNGDSLNDGIILSSIITSPDEADVAPATATGIASLLASTYTTDVAGDLGTQTFGAGHFEVMTDSSSRVRHREAVTAFGNNNPAVTSGDLDISTYGWIDTRGRFN